MRTDYFDDLFPELVTPVTRPVNPRVTVELARKSREPANFGAALLPLHPLPANDGEAGVGAEEDQKRRPSVFEYQLADQPGEWLIMLSGPDTDLQAARGRLEGQFGADRITGVRRHGER